METLLASELRYRRLFEAAKDGILILDAETGMIVDVNPFLIELLGLSHEIFLGRKIWELGFFKDIAANEAKFAELQAQEYVRYENLPLETADGRRIAVEFVSNVYLENQKKVIQCNIRDISARKRAEDALHAAQQLTEGILNALPVRVFWKDKNLAYLGCNAAFAQDAGFADPKDVIGKDDYQMGWRDQDRSDDRQVIESGCPKLLIEEFQTTSKGNTITLLSSKIALRNSDEEICGMLGVYTDITERKMALAEQAHLAAIVQSSEDAIIGKNLQGLVTSWNAGAEKLFGYPANEMLGQPIARLFPPNRLHEENGILDKIRDGEYVQHYETVRVRKDGTLIDVALTVSPIKDSSGRITGTSKVVRDITRRKREEENLRRFATVVRDSNDAITIQNFEGGITAWNHGAEQMYGYSEKEALLMNIERLTASGKIAEQKEFIRRLIAGEAITSFETQRMTKDGRILDVWMTVTKLMDGAGIPIGLASTERDITERKQAEAESSASQQLMEGILNAIPVRVFWKDRNLVYLGCNAVFAREAGFADPKDIIGKDDYQTGWSDQAELYRGHDREVIESGCSRLLIEEPQKTGSEGNTITPLASKVPLRDSKGEICGVIGTYMDITDRKKAEKAIFESNEQFRVMFEVASIGMAQADVQTGRWLRVNQKMCAITGYSADEMLKMRIPEITHAEDRQEDWEAFQRVVQGKVPNYRMEKRYIRKDGKVAWVNVNMTVIRNADDKPVRTMATIEDITEGRQAQEKLRKNESLLKETGRIARIGGWEFKIDSLKLSWTEEVYHIHEVDMTYVPTVSNALDFYSPSSKAIIERAVQRAIEQCESYDLELELITGKGNLRCVRAIGRADRERGIIYGTIQDITDSKRTEESHTRLAKAVEQAVETIVITDLQGAILYANPAFEKSTGYTREEALGLNPRILKSGKQDAEFYQKMWDVLGRGETWSGHFVNRRKDGTAYEEEATISPVRDAAGTVVNYVAVKRDVTHEMELKAQLHQSQKMEGIGQLAGGVAHDFNNILAVISMQAGMLGEASNLSPHQTELLGEMEAVVQNGADLTRQLLIFSQRQTLQLRDLNLNESVANLGKMLQRILGEDIRMEFKCALQPLFVHADAGMMDQILMNLTVNARHAMPEGGSLIIETSAVEFDELAASQSLESRPGLFACLSVSDTGCGIASENLERIFEPFFTNKEVGKGTGLGLATVFGIVKQHKGWINVYSEINHGTTFRIYFPCLIKSDEKESAQPTQAAVVGGNETILVVEDNPHLLNLVRSALSRLGYRVLEAPTGVAALDVWKEHRNEISLLLTDLVMPDGMNGRELARRLTDESPGLKVIYASGYSAEVAGKDLSLEEGVNFLSKPFKAHKLAHTVRAMLDS